MPAFICIFKLQKLGLFVKKLENLKTKKKKETSCYIILLAIVTLNLHLSHCPVSFLVHFSCIVGLQHTPDLVACFHHLNKK